MVLPIARRVDNCKYEDGCRPFATTRQTLWPASEKEAAKVGVDQMSDRVNRGKDIAILQMGQDAYRKISEIRNCIMWLTTKLCLHTQVWWSSWSRTPARATSIGPRAATGLEVSADAAGGIPRYGITRRRGNNDRLSTLWQEVISLAGAARSFSSGGGQSSLTRIPALYSWWRRCWSVQRPDSSAPQNRPGTSRSVRQAQTSWHAHSPVAGYHRCRR